MIERGKIRRRSESVPSFAHPAMRFLLEICRNHHTHLLHDMMDYSLPAVKLHIAELKSAKPTSERPNGGAAFAIGSLVFQRVWLQGVLVQGVEKASLALKDGTGVLPIQLATGESGTAGAYVLLVGVYTIGDDGQPFLWVHKKVELSSSERDEFWQLEVTEAHKLFYEKLINAPAP